MTNYSTYSTLVFFYLSCDWPLGCLIDRLHLCGLARQLQHKVHCCHATVGSSITKYSRLNWVSLRRPLSVYFQTFCSVVTPNTCSLGATGTTPKSKYGKMPGFVRTAVLFRPIKTPAANYATDEIRSSRVQILAYSAKATRFKKNEQN